MKNLMIAAALSLGTMTAFAQEEETAVDEAGTAVEESATDATQAAEDTYDAAEEATTDAADAAQGAAQDDFSEVAVEELPEAVTTAVEEAHPGATIDKAQVNGQSQYKLKVTKEDGESAKLLMDAEGNQIEK
ncbi:MAG TPA: hypothetical protein VFM69_14515 [Pricia sp.]|nr:hypothetical protein [Pricia sp.]